MKQKAFTLVELMVVIMVIGILAAIAIPNYSQFQTRAKDGRVRSNMGVIGQGMMDFGERNNGAYPQTAASTCLEGSKTLQQVLAGAWPTNPYSAAAVPLVWTGIWPYAPGDQANTEAGKCYLWIEVVNGFARRYVVSGYGKQGKELLQPVQSP